MYNRVYQSLYTTAQAADWKASTDVTPEHTGQRIGAEQPRPPSLATPGYRADSRAPPANEQARRPRGAPVANDLAPCRRGAGHHSRCCHGAGWQPKARQSATLDSFPFKWQPPGTNATVPITANQLTTSSKPRQTSPSGWRSGKRRKESGVALKPGFDRSARPAQSRGTRDGFQFVLRPSSGPLQHVGAGDENV